MKKAIVWIIIAAIIISFSGCIPSQYKKGVDICGDFPDKILEIYDDSVVFYCDEDDDEVTIKAGSEDNAEDIIDFYVELFEDEDEITLLEWDDEEDDEYQAEGFIEKEEVSFEIEIEPAKGKYEEKLFEGQYEITVTQLSEEELEELMGDSPKADESGDTHNAVDTSMGEQSLDARILGSWLVYEMVDNSEFEGFVFTFSNDGRYVMHENGEEAFSGKWNVAEDGSLVVHLDEDENGYKWYAEVAFGTVNGYDGMIWDVRFGDDGETADYTVQYSFVAADGSDSMSTGTNDTGVTAQFGENAQKILGFWQIIGTVNGGETTDERENGVGMEFLADGSLILYSDYEHYETSVWEVTLDGLIEIVVNDGSIIMNPIFFASGGQDKMAAVCTSADTEDIITWDCVKVEKDAFISKGGN